MDPRLDGVLLTLRMHKGELHTLGADSDIDVLVDLDCARPMGVFEYARLKLYIGELFGNAADVVNRRTLKPH